jgi:hypothetical protein
VNLLSDISWDDALKFEEIIKLKTVRNRNRLLFICI